MLDIELDIICPKFQEGLWDLHWAPFQRYRATMCTIDLHHALPTIPIPFNKGSGTLMTTSLVCNFQSQLTLKNMSIWYKVAFLQCKILVFNGHFDIASAPHPFYLRCPLYAFPSKIVTNCRYN